jgi:hypothetical protein
MAFFELKGQQKPKFGRLNLAVTNLLTKSLVIIVIWSFLL